MALTPPPQIVVWLYGCDAICDASANPFTPPLRVTLYPVGSGKAQPFSLWLRARLRFQVDATYRLRSLPGVRSTLAASVADAAAPDPDYNSAATPCTLRLWLRLRVASRVGLATLGID